MLDDIKIDESYRERNKRRMDHLIPNYLAKFIRDDDVICSIGCGTGYEVELLNKLGYDAYGLDPGNRTSEWQYRAVEIQKKLRVGYAQDSRSRTKNLILSMLWMSSSMLAAKMVIGNCSKATWIHERSSLALV